MFTYFVKKLGKAKWCRLLFLWIQHWLLQRVLFDVPSWAYGLREKFLSLVFGAIVLYKYPNDRGRQCRCAQRFASSTFKTSKPKLRRVKRQNVCAFLRKFAARKRSRFPLLYVLVISRDFIWFFIVFYRQTRKWRLFVFGKMPVTAFCMRAH
jgi:hypothetical protein